MANHEQKTLGLLDEIGQMQHQLHAVYRQQNMGEPGPHARKIADLHQRINVALKLADVHATLSVRQALEDHSMQAASA